MKVEEKFCKREKKLEKKFNGRSGNVVVNMFLAHANVLRKE